jgi:hypothetical protein
MNAYTNKYAYKYTLYLGDYYNLEELDAILGLLLIQ